MVHLVLCMLPVTLFSVVYGRRKVQSVWNETTEHPVMTFIFVIAKARKDKET